MMLTHFFHSFRLYFMLLLCKDGVVDVCGAAPPFSCCGRRRRTGCVTPVLFAFYFVYGNKPFLLFLEYIFLYGIAQYL